MKKDFANLHSMVFDEFEIIVVDNNSTDKTAELAENAGARVISCSTKGVTHARQAGYKAAKYELQAYIDADSFIPEDWLEGLYNFSDPNVAAISGPVHYTDSPLFFRFLSKIFYYVGYVAHNTIGPMLQGGNFVMRRSTLDAIGGHSTNVDFYGEDTDLAIRSSKVGKVKFVLNMWNISSSRRFNGQGSLSTGYNYVMNYLWMTWFRRPYTEKYIDFRE